MTIASGKFNPETNRETVVPYILDNLKVVQRLKAGFFSIAGMINREASLATEKIYKRSTVRILTAPLVHLSRSLPFFNKKEAGGSTKVETHKGTNLTPFLNDPDLPKIKTIENDQAKRLAAKNNSLLKKSDNLQATPISSEAWSALVDGHDKSGCFKELIDYLKALPMTEAIRPLLAMFEAGAARENKLNGIVDEGKIEASREKAKDDLKNLAKQLSKEVFDLREGATLYQSFQLGIETTIQEKVVNVCVDQLNHKLKGAEGEFLKLLKNCGSIADLGTQKKDDLKAFGRKWFPESWCEAFESTLFEDFHEIFMSPAEGTKIEEAAAKFWKRLEEHGLTKSVEQTLSKAINDQIQNTGNFISQATAGVTSAIPADAKSILGEFGYHFKRPQGWLEITKQSNGLFTVTVYGKFSELDLPGPIPLVYEDIPGEILNEELFTHLFLYQALPAWKTVEEFNLSHFSQNFLSKLGDPLSLPAEREAKIKEVLLNSKDSGIGLILALISSKASENPALFLFQLKVQALKDSWGLEKKSSESSFKALMIDLKKSADDLYKQQLIDKAELDQIYATAEEIHYHFEEAKESAAPKDLNKIVKNLSFLGFGTHTILSTIREALIELFGLEMVKPIDALLQELSLEFPDPQAAPIINRRDSVLPLLQKGWKSALGQKEIGRLVQHIKKFRLSALHTLRLMLDMGTILYHPVIGNILAFFTHLALVAFVPGYTLLNSGMHLLLIRMVAQYGFDILYMLLPESLAQYLYAASIVVYDAKKFLVERVLFIATKTLIRLSIDPKTIAMINAKASFIQQSIIRSGELSFTLPGYEIHKKSVTIPKVQPAVSSQNVDQKQLQNHAEWDAAIDPSNLHETLKKWLEESAEIGKQQKAKQAYFLHEQIRRLPIPNKKEDQFWSHVKHPHEVLECFNQLSLQLANNREGDLYFDTEKTVSFYSLYAIIDNLTRTIPENHLEGYQANPCDLMLHTSSMLTRVYSSKTYQALKQVADYFEFDLNKRYTIEEINERRKECLFSENHATSFFTLPIAQIEEKRNHAGNSKYDILRLYNPKIIGRAVHSESKYYEGLLQDPAIQERLESDLKLDATFFEKYVHLYKDPIGDACGVADHEKAMELLRYKIRSCSSQDRLESLGYLPILEILHQAKRDVKGGKIQKGVLPRGFSILRMIDTLSRNSLERKTYSNLPENISRIGYLERKSITEPGYLNTYIIDPVKEKLQPVLDTLKPLTDAIRFQMEVQLDAVSGTPKKTLSINTKEELKSSRIIQMWCARTGGRGISKDPSSLDFIHAPDSSTEMGTILSKRNPGSEQKPDPLADNLTIQERINLELATTDKSDMVVRAIAYFKNAHEKLLDPDFQWLLDVLLFNVGALQKQIDEHPRIINEIGKFFREILNDPRIKGNSEAYFNLLRTAIITQTLCANDKRGFPDLRALIRLEADKRVKKSDKFSLIALLARSYVDVNVDALPLAEKKQALLDLSRHKLGSKQHANSHIIADCLVSKYEAEIVKLIREDDEFRSEAIEAMLKDAGFKSSSDQKRSWVGEFPIYSCGNDKVDLSCFTNSSVGRSSPNALELAELTHGMITSVEGSTESGGIFSIHSKPITVSDNGKRILWKRGDKTFKLISSDVLQLDLGKGAYWIEEGAKHSAVLLVTKEDQIISETRLSIVNDNAEGTTYHIDLKEVQVGNTRLHEIDLNQTTHGLTLLAWFNPLTKIKAYCSPNDKEKICRLEFTSASLNFQLKTDAKGNERMMSEGQFPGYFISNKQKIDSLKHIPKFLLIENSEGEKKCLVPKASEMGLMTQFLANEVVQKKMPDFLFKLLEEHLTKDQKEEIFAYSIDKDGHLTSKEPAAIVNMLMTCISQNDLKGAKIWLDRLQKAGRLSPFNESVLQQINLCLLPLLLFNKNEWPSIGMKLAAIRETNILMPNSKSGGTFKSKLFEGILDEKKSSLLYCILLQNGYDSYLEDLKNGVRPLLDDTDELFILNYIGRTTLSFVKDNIIDKTQPQSMMEKAADYLLPQNMIEQFLKFPAIVHRAHAIKSRLGEEISYIDALSYFMYLGYIDRSAVPAANGNGAKEESRILESAMKGLRVVDAKFSALATRVEQILGPDFMSLVDKMAMMKVAKLGLKRFKKNSDSDFNHQYIETKLFVPIPETIRTNYGHFIENIGVHLDTLFLTNPSSLQKAFPLYFRLAINSPPNGLNEQQAEIFKEKSAAFRNTLRNLDGKFKFDDQKLISFLQLMMQYNKPLTEELGVLEEYWNGREDKQSNTTLLNENLLKISREIDSLKSGIESLKRWEEENKNIYAKQSKRKTEGKIESWLDRLELNENFENVPIVMNSANLERHFIAYYAFALGQPPKDVSEEEAERFREKSTKLREELKTADQGLLFVRFLKAVFKSPHKNSLPSPARIQQVFSDLKDISAMKKGNGITTDSNLLAMQKNIADYHSDVTKFDVPDKSNCEDIYQILDASIKDLFVNKPESDQKPDPAKENSYKRDIKERTAQLEVLESEYKLLEDSIEKIRSKNQVIYSLLNIAKSQKPSFAAPIIKKIPQTVKYLKQGVNQIRKLPAKQAGFELAKKALKITQFGLYFFSPIACIPWLKWGVTMAKRVFWTARVSLETGHSVSQLAQSFKKVQRNSPQGDVSENIKEMLVKREALIGKHYQELLMKYFDAEIKEDQNRIEEPIPSYQPLTSESAVKDAFKKLNQSIEDYYARVPDKKVTYRLKAGVDPFEVLNELKGLKQEFESYQEKLKLDVETFVGSILNKGKRAFEIQEHPSFHEIENYFIKGEEAVLFRNALDQPEHLTLLQEKLYLYQLIRSRTTLLFEALDKIDSGTASDFNGLGIELARDRVYSFAEESDEQWLKAKLAFESRTGKLLWKKPLEQLKQMLFSDKKKLVIELLPGSGKTYWGIPTTDFMLADGENLPINIWPASLAKTNTEGIADQAQDLFNQQSLAVHFSRHTGWDLNRVAAFFNVLKRAILNKEQFNMTKEDAQTLELKSLEISLKLIEGKGKPDDKQVFDLMRKGLALFRKVGKAVPDETHEVFNCRKELNFPFGGAKTIKTSYATVMNQVLFHLANDPEILKHVPLKEEKWTEVSRQKFAQYVRPILAKHMADASWLAIAPQNREEFSLYISGQTDKIPAFVEKSKYKKEIGLIKGLLVHLLPHTLESIIDVNFTHSNNSSEEFAKPSESNKDPQDNSLIQNPFEAYVKTCVLNLKNGISEEKMGSLLQALESEAKEECKKTGKIAGKTKAGKFFALISKEHSLGSMDETNRLQIIRMMVKNDHAVLEYVKRYIKPQIKYYGFRLSSNPQNFASMFSSFYSDTGTPFNDGTYPKGTEVIWDKGTLGESIHILREKCNHENGVQILQSETPKDVLRELLNDNFLDSKSPYRVIIDRGALFRGLSHEFVANSILEFADAHRPDIQGVVFYTSDKKRVVLEKGALNPTPYSDCRIPRENLITYYDQGHTFGSDIPQADWANALVTVGEDIQLYNLAQSKWRMRLLKRGNQSIKIVMTRKVYEAMNLAGKKPTIDDVVVFAQTNEANELAELNYQADKQILHDIVRRQILDEAFEQKSCKKALAVIAEFKDFLCTPLEDDPFKLYGGIDRYVDPLTALDEYKKYLKGIVENSRCLDSSRIKFIQKEFDEMPVGSYPALVHASDFQSENALGMQVEVDAESNTEQTDEQNQEVELVNEAVQEIDMNQHQTISVPEEYAREINLWPWPEDLDLTNSEWLEIKAAEYALIPRGKFPLFKIKEVLKKGFYDSLQEIAHHFSPEILSTNNFSPMINTNWIPTSIQPFSPFQKALTEALVVINGNERKVIMLDRADASYWRQRLERERKEKTLKDLNIQIFLYDIELGSAVSSDKGSVDEESLSADTLFQRAIVQLKFLNGSVHYNEIQKVVLERWIRKGGVDKMQKAFLDIHKDHKTAEYPGSTIDTLFHQLSH